MMLGVSHFIVVRNRFIISKVFLRMMNYPSEFNTQIIFESRNTVETIISLRGCRQTFKGIKNRFVGLKSLYMLLTDTHATSLFSLSGIFKP